MDPNRESSTTLDATDSSSVSSLTSSFGQLELNVNITDGPINLLPNEMMQLILAKLGFDGDVKKMIRLRLVSTKWRSLVEDYCGQKKFLNVIRIKRYIYPVEDIVKKNFFGFGNSKDFVRLILNPEMPSECMRSFLKLFPNVVQLSIHWAEHARVFDFVVYICLLDSLKQLDLFGPFVSVLAFISPTLSKLEHFSFCHPLYTPFLDDHNHQLICHLGPSCVRVGFDFCTYFCSKHILQWHSINPNWLANLTHLKICLHRNSDEFGQAVHFLSEHTKLQQLKYESWPLNETLQLTPNLINELGKLNHLTELKLRKIKIDFFDLKQTAQLASLPTVVTCKLVFHFSFHDPIPSGDLCTRVLSAIFPNVVNLKLTIVPPNDKLQHEIEQHLNRFRNLLVCRIVFKAPTFD